MCVHDTHTTVLSYIKITVIFRFMPQNPLLLPIIVARSLNDSKDVLFSSTCSHLHDKACVQCEAVKEVLQHNQRYDMTMTEDEMDDLRYTYHMAEEAIRSWKAHQLRSVRQNRARMDIIDDSSVLITQAWAMKFLPQKYGESQCDWFAKR